MPSETKGEVHHIRNTEEAMAADSRSGLFEAFTAAVRSEEALKLRLQKIRKIQQRREKLVATMLKGTAAALCAVVALALLPALEEAHGKRARNPQTYEELGFPDWSACSANCRRVTTEHKACAPQDVKRRMSDKELMQFKTLLGLIEEARKSENCKNPRLAAVPLPLQKPGEIQASVGQKSQPAQGNNTELDKRQAQEYNAPEGQVPLQSTLLTPKEAEMAKTFLATAFALAFAIAPASAPAQASVGEPTTKSDKYATYIANCGRAAETKPGSSLEREAAKLVNEMSPEEYNKHIKLCQLRVPAQTAQAYPPNVDVDVDVHTAPTGRRHAPQHFGRRNHRGGYGGHVHGGSRHRGGNYAKVRAYLDNYGGPLWETEGPILNKYMNRRAPSGAVPCRPPGYTHNVLCLPRSR